MVEIRDGDQIHAARESQALEPQHKLAIQLGVDVGHISDAYLMDSLDRIEEIRENAAGGEENVIVDITSLPKRWFFPLVRSLLQDHRTKNLVAIYTTGTGYARELAFNPETVRSIPGFASADYRNSHDLAFVGVGFQAMSMLSLFNDEKAGRIQMMFPFPPGPPGVNRNWNFAENIERAIRVSATAQILNSASVIEYSHVNALDVSQNFDAMATATDNGKRTSFLAPYGPKPMSLAMCLYASAADDSVRLPDVPVYYTQPRRYALDYTTGVGQQAGVPNINAYLLKRAGKNLYSLDTSGN